MGAGQRTSSVMSMLNPFHMPGLEKYKFASLVDKSANDALPRIGITGCGTDKDIWQ